jgi:hypothetical protein
MAASRARCKAPSAVLRVAPDRGKQHLHRLIGGDFAGIVGSYRFTA